MKRGRGMSLQTIAKRAGVLSVADIGMVQLDYVVDPQVGDTVQWQHQVKYSGVPVKGKVIKLLDPREDHLSHKPEDVGKIRWLVSKNYVGCKRVIVEVEREGKLPLYYTVTYVRYAKNAFRVVEKAADRSGTARLAQGG